MNYLQPSYPLLREEMPEEDGPSSIWWLIGCCGAIVALVGLCFCGLASSVAFYTALSWPTPTLSLAMAAPVGQGPAQLTFTPSPSPTPLPLPPPPSPTPSPTPYISQGGIGQRIEGNGISLTASSVGREAQEGFICMTVDVTLENSGHDVLSYSPSDFKVKDSQGSEYTIACVANDQALTSGELAKGSSVQGKVSFQIPPGATGLFLVYQSPLVDGYGIIEIDLGP